MPKLVQMKTPINLDISVTGESTVSANPKARVLGFDLDDFLPGNNGTEDTSTVDVKKLVQRDRWPQGIRHNGGNVAQAANFTATDVVAVR